MEIPVMVNDENSSDEDLKLAQSLIDDLKSDLYEIEVLIGDGKIPWNAEGFRESVLGGVCGIEETINRTKRVTDNQFRALENWKFGVERWFPN